MRRMENSPSARARSFLAPVAATTRMTLPQRILLNVTLAAGIVIAVATYVTFRIVHLEATDRNLDHLETYVNERARREELGFQQVEANLALVRGQFLRRISVPIPANHEAQWQERFALFPDGSWRSRTNFADGRKYSTLWAHRNVNFTPELKTHVLRAQNICDDLLPAWGEAFPSVYFVFPGWLNIGFDPRIPNWVWETPADYDPSALEWFRLAAPTNRPPEGTSWTGVIEEPTTKVPIVSVYLPITRDGQFIGSVGHDLFVHRLMQDTARSHLPGTMHIIFRRDGRLIAHPHKRSQILGSRGELRMQDSGDAALTSLYRAVAGHSERRFSGYDPASGLNYSVARLAGPEWFFVTTVPRALLQQLAFQSAQWVLWSGVASLALMVGFLAVALRRQIARPLAELSRATRQMSAGDPSARADLQRRDEFGALGDSFNEMAKRVAERDAELQAEKAALERRVAERTAELRESEARLRALYESISAAVVVQDQTGFLQFNSASLKLFGTERAEDFLGKHPTEFSAPRQPNGEESGLAAQQHMQYAMTHGTKRFEWLARRLDGTEFPVEVTLTALELQGRPVLQAVIIDLSERKRAEMELQNALAKERELSQLKSEFVSLVSHEFRTPLEIILSSADNLRRYHDRLNPEKREHLLRTIDRSVRRMSGMMEEVLVLGRLETDRMTFKPVDFDLASFCQRICDEIESATNRRCPIRLLLPPLLEQARGDENILRHVFANLLANAVKYSPAGSEVDFAVTREGEHAVFRVRDHGCGIPAADQKRLFQAFHRGSNVGQIPGTGLGLLIVQRCVDLHSGQIHFQSSEGIGTTFTVRLALFSQPPVES